MLLSKFCKFERLNEETMRITRWSQIGQTTNTKDLPITAGQWQRFSAGQSIQDALPHLTLAEREFILSGSTEEDWARMFGPEEE